MSAGRGRRLPKNENLEPPAKLQFFTVAFSKLKFQKRLNIHKIVKNIAFFS